jgi:hypothetical protein
MLVDPADREAWKQLYEVSDIFVKLGGAVLTDDLSDLTPLGAAAGVRIMPLRHA